MAKTFKVDDDVREVLKQAVIDGESVRLVGQLDRKLYERVNKVLEAAGGKWSRKANAHLFAENPRQLLALAVQNGVARNLRQEQQTFFTPPAIAARVIELADIRPGMSVLEPSAGTGNLARQAREAGGKVECIEIDQKLAGDLLADGFAVQCGDFLQEPVPTVGVLTDGKGTRAVDDRFERVVMNPPFANGFDIKHVLHALSMLRPGGRLVAVCCNGPRQQEQLRPLAAAWFELPADSFAGEGTEVNVAILVIEPAGDRA